MKLYLKNKIISVGNGSSIKDGHGKDFFRVNGKPFSKRKKKYLCDLSGKTLYRIQNKRFFASIDDVPRQAYTMGIGTIMKAKKILVVVSGADKAAIVKKAFTIGEYLVSDTDSTYVIKGKVLSRIMDITRDDEIFARVGREFDIFRDSYFVEAEDENMPFALALVVAIDNIIDATAGSDR